MARESQDFFFGGVGWGQETAIALAASSVVFLRVKGRFLIIALFVLTPNQESKDLSKEVNLAS